MIEAIRKIDKREGAFSLFLGLIASLGLFMSMTAEITKDNSPGVLFDDDKMVFARTIYYSMSSDRLRTLLAAVAVAVVVYAARKCDRSLRERIVTFVCGLIFAMAQLVAISYKHTASWDLIFETDVNQARALWRGIAYLILFYYLTMFGIVTAFKDFNFADGIFGSPWISPLTKNFEYLFSSGSATRATWNTIMLNLLFIVFGLVFELGFALMFHELRMKKFKSAVQFGIFLPYFISWIVVGLFSYNLFNYEHGSLNTLLKVFGMEAMNWYENPKMWIVILVVFRVWKMTGYGMIMYIAALGGIDTTYYEAAKIDGASRWQQIKSISLPVLAPTAITLLLLNCGKIMNADFGMFYSMIGNNAQLYSTTDVLDTFIYRNLRLNGDVGMSSAAGLYQSVLSTAILLFMNRLARKHNPDGALF